MKNTRAAVTGVTVGITAIAVTVAAAIGAPAPASAAPGTAAEAPAAAFASPPDSVPSRVSSPVPSSFPSSSPSSIGDDLNLGPLLTTPPTIPYEPPELEHGGVRSPKLPAAAWDRAERTIGRLAGKDLGMDALDDRECTPITAIHVPGTAETNEQRDPDVPHGRLVSGLGHDLAAAYGDEVRNLYLPYPSDVLLTTSYRASADRGVEILRDLVDRVAAACPDTRFVFSGYSQGADIVNRWAGDALAGRTGLSADQVADRVVGIAMFGNPRRGPVVAEAHGTAPTNSLGILGPSEGTWGPLSDRVFDSCNAGDVWCDSTPGMRALAPAVMTASLNPRDADGTLASIEAVAGTDLLADPEVRRAVEKLLRFLLDESSDHLQYETEADGVPSARTAAREFLMGKIGPAKTD